MDNNEVHYLTFDPDEMWTEMMLAYAQAGGDPLYPGDEKEILLRGVQGILAMAYAAMDNALRMNTLRYAVGDYLDMFGESRFCPRIEALPARATVKITFRASGVQKTIPAGTAMTADGVVIYKLENDLNQTGNAGTVFAAIVCSEAGEEGNGLVSGTQMSWMIPETGVTLMECSESATGGCGREDDDTYRARIAETGISNVTTGPKARYEAVAMGVSSVIEDASAVNTDDGEVTVYLILSSQSGASALISAVEAALNDRSVRPLTDTVTVAQATDKSYVLKMEYTNEAGENLTEALEKAVKDYQEWQEHTIGRAFDPDKLKSLMYNAGAGHVVIAAGSSFDGGTAEYTEIDPDERCVGSVTLTEV